MIHLHTDSQLVIAVNIGNIVLHDTAVKKNAGDFPVLQQLDLLLLLRRKHEHNAVKIGICQIMPQLAGIHVLCHTQGKPARIFPKAAAQLSDTLHDKGLLKQSFPILVNHESHIVRNSCYKAFCVCVRNIIILVSDLHDLFMLLFRETSALIQDIGNHTDRNSRLLRNIL